jgi:hypothetical protein
MNQSGKENPTLSELPRSLESLELPKLSKPPESPRLSKPLKSPEQWLNDKSWTLQARHDHGGILAGGVFPWNRRLSVVILSRKGKPR